MNGSPSLAELEYKRKYDNIVRPVHWDFAGKRGEEKNGVDMYQRASWRMKI